jgi:hypothetical protein
MKTKEENMRKVYIFNPETREYVGEEYAFVEPVNGSDLCLPNGTFFEPFSYVPSGHSQVFHGGAWRIVPDFRGRTAFDTTTQQFETITQLGNIPDSKIIVDDATKQDYLAHPSYYVVTETSLAKRSDGEIADINIEEAARVKRRERNAMFSTVDWKIARAEDATRLHLYDGYNEILDCARYRQYLRDFTKHQDWWTLPILTQEEFIKYANGE